MTKLSVVTPCFRQVRYVRETLDSVARLRTPHEHIIFDGGSDDGTLDVLREHAGPDVRSTSEPDRGQTHAVNKAIEAAAGDLVMWINADDAVIPDAVDRAVERLQSDPDFAAVYGGVELIDAESKTRRTYVPEPWSWRRFVYLGDYIPLPTVIFRRQLVDQAGLLDEQWRDAADYDFYLRLFEGRRVERIPEPLVRFRFHEDSKTSKDVWTQQRELLEIRLNRARNRRQRAAMIGIDRAKRAILPRISHWPKLLPDEGDKPSLLIRAADRWRRLRAG
jgi:glycosyltransferase involved in cell wall biosynthesis